MMCTVMADGRFQYVSYTLLYICYVIHLLSIENTGINMLFIFSIAFI